MSFFKTKPILVLFTKQKHKSPKHRLPAGEQDVISLAWQSKNLKRFHTSCSIRLLPLHCVNCRLLCREWGILSLLPKKTVISAITEKISYLFSCFRGQPLRCGRHTHFATCLIFGSSKHIVSDLEGVHNNTGASGLRIARQGWPIKSGELVEMCGSV